MQDEYGCGGKRRRKDGDCWYIIVPFVDFDPGRSGVAVEKFLNFHLLMFVLPPWTSGVNDWAKVRKRSIPEAFCRGITGILSRDTNEVDKILTTSDVS